MIDADIMAAAVLAVVLAAAAVNDVRSRRIPNRLVYPAILAGMAYHAATRGLEGFLYSAGGLGLGLLLLIFFYLAGGMGAGDVKLMGAVGSFLGAKGVLIAFFFTAAIGGLYAIILIARAGRVNELVRRCGFMAKFFFTTGKLMYLPPQGSDTMPSLCYGVAIAIGTSFSVLLNVLDGKALS